MFSMAKLTTLKGHVKRVFAPALQIYIKYFMYYLILCLISGSWWEIRGFKGTFTHCD